MKWSLLVVMALASCDGNLPPATNPDARLVRHEALLYPGSCASTEIIDARELGDLRTRAEAMVVTPSLHTGGWFHALDLLTVCGVAPGTAVVELLNRTSVVDAMAVEVAPLHSLAIGASQHFYGDEYPPIPAPVALLVDQRAILSVVGLTDDGRTFDGLFDDAYDAAVDRPVEVSLNLGAVFEVVSPAAGIFPVTLSGGSREYVVELVTVSPDDVERIEVRALELGEGRWSYAVTGVTADGLQVLGLAAELTIDGTPAHAEYDLWRFTGSHTDGASVVATWNGLSATLP
ncbi:MAG: hypothetical protein IPG81_15890 [Sandaracinaceae bacterium]|nr:hypothetical protein [Sandaracinaceae bacterium]MBK7153713.1 hypothetical protein [Sandaracinaceae bacterium]